MILFYSLLLFTIILSKYGITQHNLHYETFDLFFINKSILNVLFISSPFIDNELPIYEVIHV